jgi:hypothetical protein
MICRSTKDPKLKSYYTTYCSILSEVIKMATKLHYNKLIINSNNKVMTVRDIVIMETKQKSNDVPPLNIDGKTIKDYHSIVNIFIPPSQM